MDCHHFAYDDDDDDDDGGTKDINHLRSVFIWIQVKEGD